jgi:hypothetical protein
MTRAQVQALRESNPERFPVGPGHLDRRPPCYVGAIRVEQTEEERLLSAALLRRFKAGVV